jgi:hypothetical protein
VPIPDTELDGVVLEAGLVTGLELDVVGDARGLELPPQAASTAARASIAVTAAIRRSARATPLRRCLGISTSPVSHPRRRLITFLPLLRQTRTSVVRLLLRSVLTLATVRTVTITWSLCAGHENGFASARKSPDGLPDSEGAEAAEIDIGHRPRVSRRL